ncbi:hypothetical protein [Marinomonas polaris]|uniref:hypothetical protein n=1 Tax=Marinomonas polaris TaxID=293552 RepID=UPI0011148A6A|nr:hypothetical protein [Marinomonas polaris]
MTLILHKVAQSGLRRTDFFVVIRVKPKRRASLAQRNVPLKAKLSSYPMQVIPHKGTSAREGGNQSLTVNDRVFI